MRKVFYIAVALSVIFMIFKSVFHFDLPPGFSLMKSSEGDWAWVDQDGFQDPYTSETRFGSIQDAWSWKEYEDRKKNLTWKHVEGDGRITVSRLFPPAVYQQNNQAKTSK